MCFLQCCYNTHRSAILCQVMVYLSEIKTNQGQGSYDELRPTCPFSDIEHIHNDGAALF